MSDAQEETEAERRRAKELENELHTSTLQAEVDKLRALEALREKFDAEREQLRDDHAQDGGRFKEWKDTAITEKELTEQVRQLKEELEKLRSKSRSRSSSKSTSGGSEGHTPESPDARASRSPDEPVHDHSPDGGDDHTHGHEGSDDHTHGGDDDSAHRGDTSTSTAVTGDESSASRRALCSQVARAPKANDDSPGAGHGRPEFSSTHW